MEKMYLIPILLCTVLNFCWEIYSFVIKEKPLGKCLNSFIQFEGGAIFFMFSQIYFMNK